MPVFAFRQGKAKMAEHRSVVYPCTTERYECENRCFPLPTARYINGRISSSLRKRRQPLIAWTVGL